MRAGRSRTGFNAHFEADLLQPPRQPLGRALALALVHLDPHFPIHRAIANDEIRDLQDAVGHSHGRFRHAPAPRYTEEQKAAVRWRTVSYRSPIS